MVRDAPMTDEIKPAGHGLSDPLATTPTMAISSKLEGMGNYGWYQFRECQHPAFRLGLNRLRV